MGGYINLFLKPQKLPFRVWVVLGQFQYESNVTLLQRDYHISMTFKRIPTSNSNVALHFSRLTYAQVQSYDYHM